MDEAQRETYPLLNWCLNYRLEKRMNGTVGIEYAASKVSNWNLRKVVNASERGFNGTDDSRLLKAFNSGLFIRRGHLINGVQWQQWPDDL